MASKASNVARQVPAEVLPKVLYAVHPTRTLSVSVTGQACSLGCSHCGGHYLKHMVHVDNLETAVMKGKPKSILLSGGCDPSGAVPLMSSLDKVKDLAKRAAEMGHPFRVNAHPGVVSPETARAVASAADVVSFDFVLDDEAVQAAFHGHWGSDDYVDTFRNLRDGKATVVPHVLIGLNRGKISGERRAVEFLLEEGIQKLIFIVFIPTPGTLWADLEPPPVDEVVELLAWVRGKAPGLDITLGCMRPAGKYREALDKKAVACGVNAIVQPHRAALAEAEGRGTAIRRKDECCAFG